jgi:mono/diheme cytochrome c family protein
MKRNNNKAPLGATLALAVIAVVAMAAGALAQSADPADAGKAVFKRANCVGCHKWHGNGGGGYGGDALSLRKTELTKDQIIETVECGRPGTGMPFFMRGAYDTTKCHGMNRQEVGAQIPPEANVFLRHEDVEAVADYVLTHIKGRGEPTYAECADFFGTTSHVCDIYKTEQPSGIQTSTGQPK